FDCEGSCEGIAKALNDLFPMVNECNFSAECYALDVSYCDFGFGCYFAPVSEAKDITVFDELSAVYSENNCSKIACKSLPPPQELFCIEHKCKFEFSCEQLLAEIDALFKSQKSTWCNTDADCKFIYAEQYPFCGDACDCHIAVNNFYEEEAWVLIETAHNMGCFPENMPACACFTSECEEIPTPKCDNGVCK
ncbi:MAG: hypothetical protein FJ088_10390, partial [Deltaproteobacteria bacterium]|nr:hypothetical protein [Deltaproteobacteria bacterium]